MLMMSMWMPWYRTQFFLFATEGRYLGALKCVFIVFFNPGGTDFNLVYNFWANFFMLIHWISFLFGLKKIGGFAFYPPRAKVDHRGGRLKEAWTESKPGRFFPQLVMDPMDPSPHDSQLVMARQKWLQNAVPGLGMVSGFHDRRLHLPIHWMDEWMNWTLDCFVCVNWILWFSSLLIFPIFSLYRPPMMPELVGELPPGRALAHGGLDSAVANFQKSQIARIETCWNQNSARGLSCLSL